MFDDLKLRYPDLIFSQSTIPEAAINVANIHRARKTEAHGYSLGLEHDAWFLAVTDFFPPFSVKGARYTTILQLMGVDHLPHDANLQTSPTAIHTHRDKKGAMITQWMSPDGDGGDSTDDKTLLVFTIVVDFSLCPPGLKDGIDLMDYWARTTLLATEYLCCANSYLECRELLEQGAKSLSVRIPRSHPTLANADELVCSDTALMASLKWHGFTKGWTDMEQFDSMIAALVASRGQGLQAPFWKEWCVDKRVHPAVVVRRLGDLAQAIKPLI